MNNIRTHRFHKLWLKISAVLLGIFGPVLFLGTMDTTAEPARWVLDLLSWPIDGQQFERAVQRSRFAYFGWPNVGIGNQ